jgi:hypothetical protein
MIEPPYQAMLGMIANSLAGGASVLLDEDDGHAGRPKKPPDLATRRRIMTELRCYAARGWRQHPSIAVVV